MFGIVMMISFSLIYAWGTRNAGTAMRHRDMLCGPIVMIVMYALNECEKSLDLELRIDNNVRRDDEERTTCDGSNPSI